MRAQCAERRQAGDLSASSATAADADSEEAQQREEADAEQGGRAGRFSKGRHSGGTRTPSRRYWASVCLLLRQFDGLVDGYGAAEAAVGDANAVGRMHYKDFLFVMSNGETVLAWSLQGSFTFIEGHYHERAIVTRAPLAPSIRDRYSSGLPVLLTRAFLLFIWGQHLKPIATVGQH